MGSKEDKESFWGFKSNITFVLLLLGAMVIGNFLYENYQSFEEEKQNERWEEARKLTENEPKELESNEQKAEKIKNDLIGRELKNAAWNFDKVSEFRKFEITKETIDNSQRIFEIYAELQGYRDQKIYETKMVVTYNIRSHNETIEDVYAIDFVDIYERDKIDPSNDEKNSTQNDIINYIECQWCGDKFKVSKESTQTFVGVIYYWKGGVHSCNERDAKEQANEEKKDFLHTLELAQTRTLSPAKYCSKECACKAYYYK
jgi:hypothetical protein